MTQDHDGPQSLTYWALCPHDILARDCPEHRPPPVELLPIGELLAGPIPPEEIPDFKYQARWPQLWPYLEELERAAEYLAHTHKGVLPHEPFVEVEYRVARAKAILGTAARRYARAVSDLLDTVRFR